MYPKAELEIWNGGCLVHMFYETLYTIIGKVKSQVKVSFLNLVDFSRSSKMSFTFIAGLVKPFSDRYLYLFAREQVGHALEKEKAKIS